MTKWERNLKKVERAHSRAQALITQLEGEGYRVRKSLKELVEKPIGKRYTEHQMKVYTSLLNANRIRSAAMSSTGLKASSVAARNSKTVNLPTLAKHSRVTTIPRVTPKVRVREGHNDEDIARAFYRDLKWTMNEHPNRDTDELAWRLFKMLKQDTGLTGKRRIKAGKMREYINTIKEDDFVKSYTRYSDKTDMEALHRIYYSMGRSSEEQYKNTRQIAFEDAKLTFAGNHPEYTENGIEALYDFFANSSVWSKYMKVVMDSDQIEDISKVASDALSTGNVTVKELDLLLMSSKKPQEIVTDIEDLLQSKVQTDSAIKEPFKY